MNKARLTYRFDRTGARTDDLENEINSAQYRTIENNPSENRERAERVPMREKSEQREEEHQGRAMDEELTYNQLNPKQHRSIYSEEEELYANFYKGNYDSLASKKHIDKGKVVSLFDDDFHVLSEDRQHTIFTNHNSNWDTDDDQETKRIERLIRDSGAERNRGEDPERNPKWGDEWNQRGAYPSNNSPLTHPASTKEGWEPDRRGTTVDHYYQDNRDRESVHTRTAPVRDDRRHRYGEGDVERGRYEERTRYDDLYRYDESKPYSESNRYMEDFDLYPGVKSTRRKNMPWIKVVASLTAAVATGGLLGYFVLTLFSGAGSSNTVSPTAAVQSELSNSADHTGLITLPGADLTAAALEANITLPAKTFIMLQNGKFSTSQTAASAAEALDAGGYASATDAGEYYYVYAGIAADRDSVKALADKLKSGNFEIYAKEVTLPAVSHVNWNEGTETLQAYIEETDKIVRMISGLTLIHLEEESVTPLDKASLQALKNAHQAWSQQASIVNAGATESAKAKLQRMHNAVNTAEQSLEAYSKKPADSLLWQAQTNLMQCILAEKDLLAAITS
ncbi:MAG: hypothetical protein H7X86_07235 [Gorillibacterium sp.]|nr:hypothetical protein [Gorillibacterium sp.]